MNLFFVFQLVVLIYSVIIHEISHGYMAERLGDPTARIAGRLTLNPIPHIDLFGSIILPLLLFMTGSPMLLGWAKPVPYDPTALYKDYKRGPLKVALAGPFSNIVIFVVFGLLARFLFISTPSVLVFLFAFISFLNLWLALFNLIPIPPLDGSKLLTLVLPSRYAFALERVGTMGIILVFALLFLITPVLSAIASYIFPFVVGGPVASIMLGG